MWEGYGTCVSEFYCIDKHPVLFAEAERFDCSLRSLCEYSNKLRNGVYGPFV